MGARKKDCLRHVSEPPCLGSPYFAVVVPPAAALFPHDPPLSKMDGDDECVLRFAKCRVFGAWVLTLFWLFASCHASSSCSLYNAAFSSPLSIFPSSLHKHSSHHSSIHPFHHGLAFLSSSCRVVLLLPPTSHAQARRFLVPLNHQQQQQQQPRQPGTGRCRGRRGLLPHLRRSTDHVLHLQSLA